MARAVDLLVPAIGRLAAAGVPDPARDARRLLAFATGIGNDRLTLILPEELSPEAAEAFEKLIQRRVRREPVSHIVGVRAFYGREFLVTKEVLDPRPETEMLVEVALAEPFNDVLDLGTGSGAILLTLLAERPSARGVGTDISSAAVTLAQKNAARFGLRSRAEMHRGNWFDAVPPANYAEGGQPGLDNFLDVRTFDLIVSNPPYIALNEISSLAPEVRLFEPRQALTDGGDGLEAYRAIIDGLKPVLRPGGRIVVEIGPSQADAVVDLFRSAGLRAVTVLQDLDGRDRVVAGRAEPRTQGDD